MPETQGRSSDDAVRTAVAAAGDRRRWREASRQTWRIAPSIAAVCLVVAALSRWLAWPRSVPIGVLIAAVAAILVLRYLHGRDRAISDGLAARIDEEGRFGGELRSASWFAARDVRDDWATFHLEHAAARLSGTDWAGLYPVPRAPRARWATAGLFVTAVVVAATLPGRARMSATGLFTAPAAGVAAGDVSKAVPMQMIPADLRKKIEDLLAAAERGDLSKDKKAAKTAAELWSFFASMNEDVDVDKLKELAKAMDPTGQGSAKQAAKKMAELAGRAQMAADTKPASPELRKALEDLGMQMAESAVAEERSASDQSESQGGGPAGKDAQPGSAASSSTPPKLDDASIQFSKESQPAAGAGMMMMSDQPGPLGDPSSGFGGAGNSGAPKGGGKPVGMAQALRKETVEASADAAGANVMSEVRRKTEHGQATVALTQTAAGASDRSRAAAPPPVPEGRRASVQTYFTRKQ